MPALSAKFRETTERLAAAWPRMGGEERRQAAKLVDRLSRGYRTNRYIKKIRPHIHPKQRAWLANETTEAFFGGAAGGGKTDALLLSAIQYADVKNYSAILFRKTFTDMQGAGAIMTRARQWMSAFPGVRWSAQEKTFFFPEGSRLSFAYLEHEGECERYQGWEFNFVGFDELTHHTETNYTYLFSRLRRLEGSLVPPRMRATSNPGGKYGEWVRSRFVPAEYLKAGIDEQFSRIWHVKEACTDCDGTGASTAKETLGEPCIYCEASGIQLRTFIPSRLRDNPSLDQNDYRRSLRKLSPKDRAALEDGRWDFITSGGVFDQAWFRQYSRAGDHVRWLNDAGRVLILPPNEGVRFLTIDTAMKDRSFNDYTVIAAWALDPISGNLFLTGVFRGKLQVPDILSRVLEMSFVHSASVIIAEDAASGIGVIQELNKLRNGQHPAQQELITSVLARNATDGPHHHPAAGAPVAHRERPFLKPFAVLPYNPHDSSKISRASVAQVMARAGRIWIPAGSPEWLSAWMNEVVRFPEDRHDDCVDTLSMAAWYVSDPSTTALLNSQKPPEVGVGSPGPMPLAPSRASPGFNSPWA